MFSSKYLDFQFPLFTTSMHMLVQFTLASLVLYFVPYLRPRADSITNPQNRNPIHRDSTPSDKPLMARMFYLTRIGPCGAATGLDIGLGNMSLRFISLTFFSEFFVQKPTVFKLTTKSNVQILGLGIHPFVCLHLPPRAAVLEISIDNSNYDRWRYHDGRR